MQQLKKTLVEPVGGELSYFPRKVRKQVALAGHTVKPLVLQFVGGYWGGKTLRSDSRDYNEHLLAAACYQMSHHGAVGEACVELSSDAAEFAIRHGWAPPQEAHLWGYDRYSITERRETATELVVTLAYQPTGYS